MDDNTSTEQTLYVIVYLLLMYITMTKLHLISNTNMSKVLK